MTTHSDAVRHRLGVTVTLLFALLALVAIVLNAPVAYAGKDASFEVTVTEIREYRAAAVNDDMASNMGFENLSKLREAVQGNLEGEYAAMSRTSLKRRLLDKLSELHDFEVPAGMVDLDPVVLRSHPEGDEAQELPQMRDGREVGADPIEIARVQAFGPVVPEDGRIQELVRRTLRLDRRAFVALEIETDEGRQDRGGLGLDHARP